MIYRERCNTDLYEEHLRDIVLRRHSAIGPWLVMGLGVMLVLFLSYLVYSNVLRPSQVAPSPERSLRMITDTAPATTVTALDDSSFSLHPSWRPAATSVPQSRATNALVGGEGPALLPVGLAVTVRDLPRETH